MTGSLFPENYSKIWIRGRFITMAGLAVRGKLTLAPTVTGGALVNRSAKLIMSSAPFSADTDPDGYVAVQVPATNDPDITPINFTYAVTTPIGQKFSIVVPYDTTPLNSVGDPLHGQPVIELIDVVPVGSSGGVGQLLRGIGIQSMALVDSDVVVTYTNGDVQNLGNFPTAGSLAALADYDGTTPPADGQAIVWDATAGKFKPRDVAGSALDPDLTDIATLTPTDGQLLIWTAGHWVAADTAEITPADIGAQPAGDYATLVSGTIPDAQIPTGIARDSEVAAAVAALVASAPSTLDTLDELAAALGDDPNYAATVTAALGTKAPKITPTSTKTANYTAVAGDLVVCDATAGGFTVTLPAATAGARISIRKADTGPNAVTVAAAGADTIGTINPVTSLTLPIAGNLELIGLAGGWVILSVGASTATLDTRYALPRLAAGNYFHATSPAGASTNNAQGNGTLRLMPWWVPRTVTIDRIGAEVSAVGEAGSKFRLGVYADNGNAYPGALLLDAGQIAADSATVQELTCSLTLPPGLYWVGGAVQSAPTTQPTMRVNSTWYPPVPIAIGGLPAANSAAVGYSQTGVSGALPSTFSTTVSTAGSVTRVFARTA